MLVGRRVDNIHIGYAPLCAICAVTRRHLELLRRWSDHLEFHSLAVARTVVGMLGERAAGVEGRAFLGESGRRHCNSGWRMDVDPLPVSKPSYTGPGRGRVSGREAD